MMFAGSGARCELGYEDGVETDGELVDVRSLFGGPSSLDKIGGIQGSVRSEELGPKRPRYDCLASSFFIVYYIMFTFPPEILPEVCGVIVSSQTSSAYSS
jgi:hypothetical protein